VQELGGSTHTITKEETYQLPLRWPAPAL